MVHACIRHSDRLSERQQCATTLRDNDTAADSNQCYCCDECRELCLTIPHGSHGQPREVEWEHGVCKVCGYDSNPWIEHMRSLGK